MQGYLEKEHALLKKIAENLWNILSGGVEEGDMQYISIVDIESLPRELRSSKLLGHFMMKVFSLYDQILKGKDFVVYAWYDAMAGQLRFNAIPNGISFPFGCRINTKATICNIVEDVFSEISSLYRNDILDVASRMIG